MNVAAEYLVLMLALIWTLHELACLIITWGR